MQLLMVTFIKDSDDVIFVVLHPSLEEHKLKKMAEEVMENAEVATFMVNLMVPMEKKTTQLEVWLLVAKTGILFNNLNDLSKSSSPIAAMEIRINEDVTLPDFMTLMLPGGQLLQLPGGDKAFGFKQATPAELSLFAEMARAREGNEYEA